MAATVLAVNAPPEGAVESTCAVKLALEPVTEAPLVAVTAPVPVGETPVNVYPLPTFAQPEPAIAP